MMKEDSTAGHVYNDIPVENGLQRPQETESISLRYWDPRFPKKAILEFIEQTALYKWLLTWLHLKITQEELN